MLPLPASARISAQPRLADALIAMAVTLPAHADRELYAPALQQELAAAFRAAAGPAFDALVGEIRARLAAPPHAAYVTGLQFDATNLLFVAMSSAFGRVVDPYGQSWSRLVRYILPSTDRAIDGVGILNEALHTDGTDWREPNDLTCLLCVTPDQHGGGRSRLLDAAAVGAVVREHLGAGAAAALEREPVPWRIADELGGGVEWSPVLGARGIRWLRFTIDDGLPAATAARVDALHELLWEPPTAIDFAMDAGALLIVHNKRCLHGRTSIADPAGSERCMLRTKVLRDGAAVGERPPAWGY